MQKKTHIAAGVAVSIFFLCSAPGFQAFPELMVAGIGARLPDIDHPYLGRKKKGKIIFISILCIFITSFIYNENLFKEGAGALLNMNYIEMMIGAILFWFITATGSRTSHRTFTHSILGTIMLSYAVYMMSPKVMSYFVAGYISHILLDILNLVPVSILWPAGNGVCLGLYKSRGVMNEIIYVISIIYIVLFIVASMMMLFAK